jgi:hypothetical protein
MRLLAVPAVALSYAAVAFVGSPAYAAGCTVTPHVPSRLSITTGERDYTATLTGCAGDLNWAAVDLSRVGGPSYETYSLWWDGDSAAGGRSAHFTVYDYDRVGGYKTVSGAGDTNEGDSLAWHTASTSLRYGSWTSVSTARKGSKVTISTAVSRYVADTGRAHYAGRLMTFQARHSVHDNWSTLGYSRTGSTGRASITHTTSRVNYYRVVLTDISTVWGSASGMSRR